MLSVHLGPFASSLERAVLLLAIIVALVVGALLGRRHNVASSGALMNVLLIGLLIARVAFVVRYFDQYRHDWLAILDVRDGGFDAVAGLIGGLAAALWILVRTPALRKPVGIALLAGAGTWGATTGLIALMDDQARSLPAVQLQTLDGRGADLPGLAANGKPMVVNLWATWCPPCRREMPMLAQAQAEHPEVTFVFVNQGEGVGEVRNFLRQTGVDLDNVLLDPHGALGQAVGSRALPTTLFYDAEGRLADTHLGQLSRATLARGLSRAE